MPWCRTSTAKLAPKDEMKLFVAAYSAVNGEAMAAAALDVNTMQPRSFFCTCQQVRKSAALLSDQLSPAADFDAGKACHSGP